MKELREEVNWVRIGRETISALIFSNGILDTTQKRNS